MVYYGDLSNVFLGKKTGKRWTKKRESDDIEDRKKSLADLKRYGTREFSKSNYHEVRDLEDVFKESLASAISGPLSLLTIGDELVEMVAPDMEHYWNPDTRFGSDVRWRLTEPLARALKSGDDILLIGHSLGSIVCYDVLWKFSHYGEYQKDIRSKRVNTLVTIGSPLGDENVKRRLKGAQVKTARRYPQNIGRWINMAAEDDYISHDPTLANDYKRMVQLDLTSSITDKRIYNLSQRGGNSNPHHGAGYLIHPEMSKIVHAWLGEVIFQIYPEVTVLAGWTRRHHSISRSSNHIERSSCA